MNKSTTDGLSAVGLRRRFGAFTAVDGVTLALEPGQRHALVGPNGAGKTTVLDLLAGTLAPSAGRIRWQGKDVTRWSVARRARAGIARTFQTPTTIPSLSTVDNLVLGAWPYHAPACQASGSSRVAGALPRGRQPLRLPLFGRPYRSYRELREAALEQAGELGLAEHVGTLAGRLSHGQRRLLDLGMALAGRPRLLLLDEPAAGLHGTEDLDRLLALLRALPGSPALLVVEHHLDVVAALADTVTVLHRGRVLATGTPGEVGQNPDVALAYPGLTGRSAPAVPHTSGGPQGTVVAGAAG